MTFTLTLEDRFGELEVISGIPDRETADQLVESHRDSLFIRQLELRDAEGEIVASFDDASFPGVLIV